ncbi:MAG: cohesin domain-containing protein [Bacteroidota bacterium]
MSKFITYLATLSIVFCSLTVTAQPTFLIEPQAADGVAGDMVNVDVKVVGFTDIASYQFNLSWNPANLSFQSVTNLTALNLIPPPAPVNFGATNAASGTMVCSWSDPTATATTLTPDSMVIFTLVFELLTDAGATDMVAFAPTLEIIQNDQFGIPNDVTSGSTFIDGPATQAGSGGGGGGGGGGTVDPCLGASGFTLVATNDTVPTGDQVCIDVQACNFTDIVSAQYTMEFDPSVLRFDSVTNMNLAQLNDGAFGATNASSGLITFSWLDSLGAGVTVPSGSIIYSMCFTAVGAGGSRDTLEFTSGLTTIDITDAASNGSHIGFSSSGGDVLISGTSASALTIGVDGASATSGDQVCLDVSVNNFNSISGLQYTMNWDDTVLEFDTILLPDPLTLSPLNLITNFNTGIASDILTFQWNSAGTGVDLANGTVIYQVCFNVIGAGGTSSPVDFIDTPTPREALQEDAMGMTSSVNIVTQAGQVNVLGAGGFQLIVDSGVGEIGDTVCVDVLTTGFNAMVSFQYTLEWDTSVLEYISFNDNILPPTTFTGTTMTGDGRFTFQWFDATTLGQTLSDSTQLYNFCFEVKGDCGDSSLVRITNGPPTVIEASQDDGTGTGNTVFIAMDTIPGVIRVCDNSVDPIVVTDTTITNIDCFGDATGAIDITVDGGVPGYTYLWSNAETSQDISGLTAGTYTVTITDSGSSSIVETYTVTEAAELTATATATDESCAGDNDGTITVTPMGGTGAYTYAWSDSNLSGANPTGVAAGTYTVTVTDANSCTNTATATVNPGASVSITATPSDEGCAGDADGSIALNVTGGSGNYTYNWTPSSLSGANPTGLAPGTYTVTVTEDGNSCTATETVVINGGASVSITATPTPPGCGGTSDGSIALDITGGSGNYSYDWSDDSLDGTEDPTGLAPGTYTVTVTEDGNNCTATETVVISSGATLDAMATPTDETCAGNADGSIDLEVTSGTGNYDYDWSDDSLDGTEDPTGLSPGTYTVTVTDNTTTCTATATATIGGGIGVNVGITKTDVSCNGANDGTITVNVSGGSGNYTYAWNPGTLSGPNPTGLSAGIYAVTVTDTDNGCTNTASVNINEAAAIAVNANVTNPDCNGESTGAISLNVSGGVAGYTYAWDPAALSGANPTGLAAGSYTVTITDQVGCTLEFSTMVTEPAPLALNATVTDESMPSFNDGEIALNITGGTPTYIIDWGNPIFNGQTTISNLVPGTYSVTVTDANGCTAMNDYVVNAADSPIPQVIQVTQISCNGADDGAITIAPFGGTPGYTYQWSHGPNSQNVTGLSPGEYTVTITDANMITGVSQPIMIDEPALLTAMATATDVSCAGATDGSINVTVNGGTANYSYSWDNGVPPVANPTGLAPDTYNVTITDANNCITTASAIVDAPTAISITAASITDAACNGEASGAIDITVSGGAGNYTYAWSDGTTVTEDLNGVPAGNYTVTITDGDGCSITSPEYMVDEATPIIITNTDITDVNCPGTPTGEIDITVSGGTAPYTYAWINDAMMNFSAAEDPSGLVGGNYTVEITDASGCTFTSNPITVDEPQAIDITLNVTNTTIANNDGGIDITDITGGMMPYNIVWTGPNGFNTTGEPLVGLMPGYYFLNVTDANGCVESVDSILVNGMVDATDEVTHVSCNGGSDGAININVMGGIAPFSYLWSNSSQLEDQVGLTAGTYTLTITDAVGSTFTRTFTVNEPAPIVLSNVEITPETGLGCNGSINISVEGGTAPYTYNWSNGANSQDITDLCKGRYSVEVIDANGCILQSAEFEVMPPPLSFGGTPAITNVQCNGGADGEICLSVLGGCEPYNFLLSTNASVVSLDGSACFANLPAGNHTVTVTDVFGDIVTVPFTITEPAAITATVSVTDNEDPTGSNCNGAIQITPSGGTSPYSYQWNNGASSEDVSGLCSDLSPYSVTITDENGCVHIVSDIVVRSIQFVVTDVTCADDCDGQINATVSGGVPPYSYNWGDGSTDQQRTGLCAGSYDITIVDGNNEVVTISSITVNAPSNPLSITDAMLTQPTGSNNDGAIDITVNGGWGDYTYQWTGPDGYTSTVADPQLLVAGNYGVIVTDANGCQVTGSYSLEADVIIPNAVVSNPNCSGDDNGSIVLDPSGGSGSYAFQWSTDPADNDPAIGGLGAGTYTVTINDGAGLVQEFEFIIDEPAPLVINFDNPRNGNVTAIASGGTAPYSYNWNTDTQDTTAALFGLQPGTYSILVIDAEGCQAIGDVVVDIDRQGFCDRVRTVITPNDDGRNDNFLVLCDEILTLELQIFDRYGRLVFQSENYQGEWIGNDASGDKLPAGGYFYVLEYIEPQSGERMQEKGHVTLVR